MARVLIIDDQVRERIKALIELAAAKPYSYDELKALAEGFDPNDPSTRTDARINEEFTIKLPVGYTVTYTHEFQPVGLCRHLAVSVDSAKLPHPDAVKEIMKLFGFKRALEECMVWLEEYAAGFSAVNVLEAIS